MKVPLKAPALPVVKTVAAVVQGPEGEELYLRITGAPLGTGVLDVTDPVKAMLFWITSKGVWIAFRVVEVV